MEATRDKINYGCIEGYMSIAIIPYNHSFDSDGVEYVGYNRQCLGLANPWSDKNQIQARFKTNTHGEALYRYREWVNNRLLANVFSGMGTIGLDDWERAYLNRINSLSQRIETGKTSALRIQENITELNYSPVPDGMEKSHAEILYKACIQLIAHRKGITS